MSRPISKMTTYILSLPKTLSAREVLAKARAVGFKTSESNVHRVRRLHRRSPSASRSVAHAPARAVRGARPSSSGSAEELLRAVAAEMGLARAVAVLKDERERVRAILGR